MNPLLKTAQKAAKEAGDAVLTLYATTDFESKVDGTPVTVADKTAHDTILKYLNTTGIPILSEEAEGIALPYPDQLWIIDPLDGTKDFLQKTGDFSVMIGLIENGRPILGVVYVPVTHTMYYAEEGRGAYMVRNGVTLELMVDAHGEQLRFLCSANNFAPYMEVVREKTQALKVPRGSIGVKAGVIAENKGDFFFSRGTLGEWDVCAPEIILKEAGGKVTDCGGKPLVYGSPDHRIAHGMIFSNGFCHERVLEAVKEAPEVNGE